MLDPVTLGVGVLVALGSAVGGYMAAPRKIQYCDFHEAFKTRLESGDKRFDTVIAQQAANAEMLARIDERTRNMEEKLKENSHGPHHP